MTTRLDDDAAQRLERNVLRSQRPPAATARPIDLPAVDRGEVAGGRVVACHLPDRPKLRLDLLVDAGPGAEPRGREGTSSVLLGVLSRGADGRDARAFALATERLGAIWSSGGEWEALRLSLDVPAGLGPPAVDLLAGVARRPTLAEEEVARVRAERVDGRHADATQPNVRAELAAREVLFTEGRFRMARLGSAETVAAVEVDDVQALHAGRFAPAAATLFVVGDLAAVDVDDLAGRVFGGWSHRPDGRDTGYGATPAPPRRQVVLLDRPGSPQARVLLAAAIPPRGEIDDTTSLRLANSVLGGAFGSRLNLRLREELGYTYGASSAFSTLRDAGIFGARWSVRMDAAVDSIVEAVTTIRTLHADGPTGDELERVRARVLGSEAIQYAETAGVASLLQLVHRMGLPDDHLERERERLRAVTVESAAVALRTTLPVDDLVTVVVGDAEHLRAPLAAADLGPVEERPFG